ncbi:MAG TPA: TonB-dependent receptor [Bryobacteraceae bacterium]|nr:TonB-dependent receptor [Bryobacteraceae bacterium]
MCLAAAFSQFSFAQNFTSSITGIVTDPTGAAILGAKVELKNMATNDVRDGVTNASGSYQFNNLNPGTYQITATAPGFKTYVQQNLNLLANTNSSVNVSLEVGGTEQKVEVTASSTLVDTETANNTVTLESRLIENLPNGTRSPLNFVFALAGTTNPPQGFGGRFQVLDQSTANFGLNGGRSDEEAIYVDGALDQAIDWGGLLVSPLQDSVQEQQVVTNTYDAQYERGGQGIVTLITKSGSNDFHGEAYEYAQDAIFNANCWSCNRFGSARGDYQQNQFGGNIGGPILKRYNLFFFGGYEGLRQPNTQNSGLLSVPTQAERNGDFSQSKIVVNGQTVPEIIYNPFTTTPVGANGTSYTRQPFSGNIIPSNLINPVGQKIANLYPLPNHTPLIPGTDVGNYFKSGSGNTLSDKMDTRVDWDQNTTHRIFFRFSDRFRQGSTNPCFYCNGADPGTNSLSKGWLAVLNDTITPSPTWVINSLVSYGFWQESSSLVDFGKLNASSIGLSPSLFQAPVLPYITADQYAQLSNSGDFADYHYARDTSTTQVNVSKELSKHTLKFGGNFDVEQISNFKDYPGTFNFSNSLTSCDPQASGPCLANSAGQQSSMTGNAIASELLGTAAGGGVNIGIDSAMTQHIFGGYIQDQWRVTPKLTLNFGVRYENQRPGTERYNRLMYFDPHAPNPISGTVAPLLGRQITGAFEYANGNNRYLWPPDNKNFAPRLAVAYKLTDKLVVRGGAGIFYLPASAMLSFDGLGQYYVTGSSTTMIATNSNGYIPQNLVSNPYPNGINQPTPGSGGLTLVGDGLGQIWIKQPHPTPYSEQWSFDLQYQITNHSVFEASYTGVLGRKLLYGNPNLDFDQLPDQFLSLGSQLDKQVPNPFFGVAPATSYLGSQQTIAYNELLRPFPQYTYLIATRSLPGARSTYNALDLKYNHTFSAGLSLLTTYRWSKAMDNGPEDFLGWATGNQWRDSYNTMLDYNISTHDVPQSFATALVYDLPYGKGKRFGNSAPALVRGVLGGWQVSSVIRIASGLPFPFAPFWSYSNHLNNYGYPGPQLADYAHTPKTTGNPVAWIDPSAFTAPPSQFVLGNVAQRYTQLRERAERNVDMALAKSFPIGERFRIQFRGEAFNLFNYAQYNAAYNSYSFCLSCGDFGDMTGQENVPRILQFSAKFIF